MSVLPELQNYELYQAFLKIFEILIQLTWKLIVMHSRYVGNKLQSYI